MVPGIYTHTTQKVLNVFSNLLDDSQSIHVSSFFYFFFFRGFYEQRELNVNVMEFVKLSEMTFFFLSILTAASESPTQ